MAQGEGGRADLELMKRNRNGNLTIGSALSGGELNAFIVDEDLSK